MNTINPEENQQKIRATSWISIFALGMGTLILIPPTYVLGSKTFAPPAATVSPLSEAIAPPAGEPTPQKVIAAKIYAPSDYLYLSQRYFNDAYILSQKRQQTDEDKKEILRNLQKAIDTISEGIDLYPNNVKLWIQRANFYTSIQSIDPQAKNAALYDIQKAQSISQHNYNQPPPADGSSDFLKGLEVVKDQQADSRDVIVAAPEEGTSPYEDSSQSSAFAGTAIIPAGQTSVTIENIHVTDAAPIYVVPTIQTNATLSVMSKNAGLSFLVALDNPQTTDIPFQYWVTK